MAEDLSPIISLTQSSANTFLTGAINCRPIGVDGKLGPETCGAIKYLMELVPPANASSSAMAAYSIVQANAWLLDLCTKPPSYSCLARAPVATPAPTSPSSASAAAASAASSARSRASMSSADMVMWGTVLAAVGLVGYAVAKKKGWIK